MPSKEQKAAEPAVHSTSDPHAVYPTYYDVKIHTLRPEGTCKATASVNINGCFAVRGIKIMESSKGAFRIHARLQSRKRRVQGYLLPLYKRRSCGI